MCKTNDGGKREVNFEIFETDKLGGNWKQQYVVAREKVIYLRLVGDGKDYRVMTATASEGVGDYSINQDRERLWEAAVQLTRIHNCDEEASEDRKGRGYIRMFTVVQDKGVSDEIFTKEVTDLIDEFFAIYDALDAEAN